MARGWEKEATDLPEKLSVPAQLSAAASTQQQDGARRRRVQGLELQRERILSERTSSPHRRSALEAALLQIEQELAQLGWTIHI